MKYLAFIGSDGATPAEAVAVMNRDFPDYLAEMERRGVRVAGRELCLPETAATVRVRGEETLVTDGPFVETKEHVAGIDVVDCADLDEAIEVEAKSPVARFLPFEIRPLGDGLRLAPDLAGFAAGEDGGSVPYLLLVWDGGEVAAPLDEQAVAQACDAWRQVTEAQGRFVLGGGLGGPETATTLRTVAGETQLSDGPFLPIAECIAGVDVVSCASRQHAIELAASHPLARYHAIEVRPFYSGAAEPGPDSRA